MRGAEKNRNGAEETDARRTDDGGQDIGVRTDGGVNMDKDQKGRMDKEQILKEIRKSAEDLEIPDSLSPENIEKKLKAGDYSRKASPKARWKKYCVRAAESAAALLLVLLAVYQVREVDVQKAAESGIRAVQEDREENPGENAEELEEIQVRMDAGETAPEDSAVSKAMPADEAGTEALVSPANSREELFQKLWDYENWQSLLRMGQKDYSEYEVLDEAEIAPMYESTGKDAEGDLIVESVQTASDFSETNLREAGVDEGDIVKTDGSYLYIMKGDSSVIIVAINGADMETVASVIPEKPEESVEEIYLDGDTLNLVTSGMRSEMKEKEEDVYETLQYPYAKVTTYDISDRSSPKVIGSVEQEGYYRSSRKSGEFVYLFTEFAPQLASRVEDSRIVPYVGGEDMAADRIYLPESLDNMNYLVISSVDSNHPSKTADSKAVVSGAENFYVSSENIYIYSDQWGGSGETTYLVKFHYENGEITAKAAGSVKGYLNDTFSLDEYQGYLRVVTTGWSDYTEINYLFVLDEDLQIVGKIEDIAAGETIRSARFMGETGYFVTFRQVDPLFSADLSQPENPRILGELKVSGFSSYLHFYGEGRLLGIGYEADEDTGITNGIKLSMFDISDPANVTEENKFVIEDAYDSPVFDNYKAIMINPEKNLFGLVCGNYYMVFSYEEEKGFQNRLTFYLEEEDYGYSGQLCRGVYVEDTFYLASACEILAFDMSSGFELEGKLSF